MFWIGVAALTAASWSDLKCREIPNWVPALTLFAAMGAVAVGHHPLGWSGVGLGLLFGFLLGILLFRTGQLGGGDAKIIMAMGPLLGAPVLVLFLGASCILGGFVGLLAKRYGAREIAFAPVMLAGLLSLLPLQMLL